MTIRTSGLVFKLAFRAKAPAVAAPVPKKQPVPDRTERRLETKIERPTARRARPERFTRARVVSGTSRLARMLALAHVVEREIDVGQCRDYTAAAERLGITKARISQIAALAMLAPELQEKIVNGEIAVTEHDLRPIAGEIDWSRQQCAAKKLQLKSEYDRGID